MTYKAIKNEIRDQDGKQVAVVLPTSCSRKVAAQMAARCAEWLNVEERNKSRAALERMARLDDAIGEEP